MGILALRERRRYNQCRRLGFHIKFTYKRIQKPTLFPHYTVNEIMENDSCLLEDSEYEDDEEVLKKDPATIAEDYVHNKTTMHREILEMKGEPYRLYRARIKHTGHKFKDIHKVISYE